MSMPAQPPAPHAAEGYDSSLGTCVDMGDLASETAAINAQLNAAEDYAQTNRAEGYAGDGSLPTGGIDLTMTGADDVPDA
jgi:hypothetical protein